MSKLLLNFENQYILITGGTRGIGKATAGLFRQQGAKVIVTGTGIDCPSTLRSEWGDDFDYIQADFSSKEGIQNFIYLLDNYQRIDVCINNAGVNRLSGIEDVSEDDYEMMLSINLHAPFSICRYMASRMKNQVYGRVVNIASIWIAITKVKRSV
jgi:3-oxoacyl-[acyl-carrier protein] reductase